MNLPRSAVVGALIASAVLVAYLPSLKAGFTGDARGLVLESPRVREFSSENLNAILTHTYWWPYGESGLYRPATTFSYLINYAILGGATNPAAYHWTNLLFHLLNTWLLYLVVRRFADRDVASWTAALWALHPVLTESVASIAGRPDLLAVACTLGGLLIYWKSAEATGARRIAWLVGLAMVTFTGAASKESAVVLPAIVVVYALLWHDRRGLPAGMIAILAAVFAMLTLRGAALSGLPATQFPFWDNPIVGAGFWTGRGAALAILGREFALLAWPARLSSDYSFAQVRPEHIAWMGIPVALCAVALLVFLWRYSRAGFFAAAAALLVWLPSSNLLFAIGAILAERFLYLPAMAFCAGVVWLARRIPNQRAAWIAMTLAAVALGARTWARCGDWSSDLTLAQSAVQASPASYKSHKMLAAALAQGGAPLDQTIGEIEKSVAILAPLPPLWNNADTWRRAALWNEEKGDPASLRRALELWERCRTIVAAQSDEARRDPLSQPSDPIFQAVPSVTRAIANVQVKLGNPAAALETDPGNPAAWVQYASKLQGEEALLAIEQGVLLSMDAGLRRRVVEYYLAAGPACALVAGVNGQPGINPACPEVRRHLCTAAARAIVVRQKSGRPDLADQLRAEGVRDFGCDPAGLPK